MITIYTVTTDTDAGIGSLVFASKDEAMIYVKQFVSEDSGIPVEEIDDPFAIETDSDARLILEEHTLCSFSLSST